jgi:hypothetical protein
MATEPHRIRVLDANGTVINIVLADSPEQVYVQEGEVAEIDGDNAAIGWRRDKDGAMVAPPAPPPPPRARRLGFRGFLSLLTDQEQLNLAGATDPKVRLFCLRALAGDVDLDAAQTAQALDKMVELDVISQARRAALVSGQDRRP